MSTDNDIPRILPHPPADARPDNTIERIQITDPDGATTDIYPLDGDHMSRPDPANWTCTIGEIPSAELDAYGLSTDKLMRDAVTEGFKKLAGHTPDYIFSGWGSPLPEKERAVVEDREPDPKLTALEHAQALATFPADDDDPDYEHLVLAAGRYLRAQHRS